MRLFLIIACTAFAYADFDTLSDNGIMQVPTSHQAPGYGVDIRMAVDTAGYAYMFGGCTYLNGAGGTHNNDVYRFNFFTGYCDRLYGCPSQTLVPANPWIGGCHAATVYDPSRNCVWFANGSQLGYDCGYGIVPAPVFNATGIWRFDCPNGPVTQYCDTLLGDGAWFDAEAHYFYYDSLRDNIMAPGTRTLCVFHIGSKRNFRSTYPFNMVGTTTLAGCFDTKRGLLALAFAASGSNAVWFFNPADTTWFSRAPAAVPGFTTGEMTYDSKNDKFLYFGSGYSAHTVIWAYDYGSNTWTRMPENNRQYNDSMPETSTWPAQRWKGAWTYSAKYNVSINWGGLCYSPDFCDTTDAFRDEDHVQPLWIYRYAKGPAAVENSSGRAGADFSSASVVYDIRGRVKARLAAGMAWNRAGVPAGIYFIRMPEGNRIVSRRVVVY